MPSSLYFLQECPTCGRMLRVRPRYLGKRLLCEHCRGPFMALDPRTNRYPNSRPAETAPDRADELLPKSVDAQSRGTFPQESFRPR